METNNMLNKCVERYLSTAKGLPFFYGVSEKEYISTLAELKQVGLIEINISDFCKNSDKNPNISDIVDFFRTADVDYKTNKYVLVGFGDYLALRGKDEALSLLREFKSKTLGNARVVILLKYVNAQLKILLEEDIRFKERAICGSTEEIHTSIVVLQQSLNPADISVCNGIKGILKELSLGKIGIFYVKTKMIWEHSILPVDVISDSYSLIIRFVKAFDIPKQMGEDDKWDYLLNDLIKHAFSLDKVFNSYGYIEDKILDDIDIAFGLEYVNWLYFIFLKTRYNSINNQYLRFVLENTHKPEDFKSSLINSILLVKKDAPQFNIYYKERKKLVSIFDEADISLFVNKNAIDSSNGICRLTDNTIVEKEAIIKWVSTNGIVPDIECVYPALYYYLKEYVFDCGRHSASLTSYFSDYKKQKVLNTLYDGFEDIARDNSMLYAHLDTRDNVLSSISDKESSLLIWVDALGVEYLSLINWIAKEKCISVKTHIVRADLPTITSVNKTFYDNWTVSPKEKVSDLDDIKHKDKGGFDNDKCAYPIHLASELDVVQKVIGKAISNLNSHRVKKVIIASDHGASRLAVLCQHDEKYDTDTKGEHSGRCCSYFDGYDLTNSVAENGYIILTDYGRFKGSRSANVEVHGGASLEETVIPLIELTLKHGSKTEISVMNADNIIVDRKKGVSVELYVSDIKPNSELKIVINAKPYYPVSKIDDNHFMFELSDIKRSGNYSAQVYENQNLLDTILIHVKGAVGSSNSAFDDLF